MAMDLATALELTLQYQPSLIAVRQNLAVSAEAIEVARQFPMSLNPTVTVDVLPWTFLRGPGGVQPLETYLTVTWAHPIEPGHRRQLRGEMAKASYTQTRMERAPGGAGGDGPNLSPPPNGASTAGRSWRWPSGWPT